MRRLHCGTSAARSNTDLAPLEQHVHSYLEMIPLMAGAFVTVLHWPQFLALFGIGSDAPRFTIDWKDEPLPVWYIITMLAAALFLELLPYLEELWRGLRARRSAQWPAS